LAQALAAMEEVGLGHLVSAEDRDAELEPITGVVLANEVADAFPVHRLVMRGGEPRERFVTWGDDWFAEVEGTPSAEALQAFQALLAEGIHFGEGDAADVNPAAATWFTNACRGLERGYAIVIDYGYAANELYKAHRLEGTVRGYYGHTVTDDPYIRIGEQDLTAHVDFTALQRAGESAGMTLAGLTTQGAFLASLGLGDLLVQLQQDVTASVADYLVAQAAVYCLIDPGGLGRFGVLLTAKNAPVEPSLRGMAVKAPGF
jgi:SAM-dependent MidA family methyltransferase